VVTWCQLASAILFCALLAFVIDQRKREVISTKLMMANRYRDGDDDDAGYNVFSIFIPWAMLVYFMWQAVSRIGPTHRVFVALDRPTANSPQ